MAERGFNRFKVKDDEGAEVRYAMARIGKPEFNGQVRSYHETGIPPRTQQTDRRVTAHASQIAHDVQ